MAHIIDGKQISLDIKDSLKAEVEELKKQGKTKGYIYTCRQKEGQFFNNAYKTPHPVEITGCEKLEDLL